MIDEELLRDIEESEEELDRDTSTKTWVQENREVVTNSIDYTLGGLVELIETGDLDLAPAFQRRLRWNNSRKSRLIESLLMNVPVPPMSGSRPGPTSALRLDYEMRHRSEIT